MFKLVFLGDIVGKVGRDCLRRGLPELRNRYSPHLVIANGENAAGGLGIDPGTAQEIYSAGVELITTGNHIWQRKPVYDYLEKNASRLIRPINFPAGVPGAGSLVWESEAGIKVGVVNSIGRVFMPQLADCPFRATLQTLKEEFSDCQIRVVDFHAEATSEKVAMGWHCDGAASLVVGTHTHVQTADDRILPKGTAFISDLGMCGPRDSVIGVKCEVAVQRFVDSMPGRFDVASGPGMLNGVYCEIDEASGKAQLIERINTLTT